MTTVDAVPAPMDIRFEGFDLKVGAPGDEEGARVIVERVIAQHLGAGWEVVPSRIDPRQFDVVPRGAVMTVPEAWDRAREMAADRDVEWAEPIMRTPNLASEGTGGGANLTAAAVSRGGGSEEAATNPNWHIDACRIRTAWDIAPKQDGKSRGEGVIVGHPDTGYLKHVEIFSTTANRIRVADAFDFVDDRADALAPAGGSTHGTATGSVIMSSVEPVLNPHVEGVAPMCELIPMRTDNDVIHFSWNTARRAVERAIEKGCHVISMSFGGPISGPSFHRAIRTAVEKGILVVAAAGNQVRFVTFPGRYPEVICVAATNLQSVPWSGSCRGDTVDVSAPGENVWRATVEGGADVVKPSSGTSYATAVVAGVAALWLAHHGRNKLIAKYGARNLAAVFKELLMTQGVDVPTGWDRERFGAGIVNAEKVLNAPLPETAPSRGVTAVRAVAGAAVRTEFDEIAHYFPEVPRDVVRANLVAILNTTDAQLDAELARFGDEMKLHAAMNPEIRARIASSVSRDATRGAADAAAVSAEGRSMLSTSLRGHLAL